MSHSSSPEKAARKAKQPKSKTTLPDADETSAAEPVASTSAVHPEPGKKKKKSKSRPAEGDEPSHAPSDQTNNRDAHIVSSDRSSEDAQLRNKKKGKHIAAEETVPEVADVNTIESSHPGEQTKKRKKSKKAVGADGSEGDPKKESREVQEVDETSKEKETTVSKKSRKEKKRKRNEHHDEEAMAAIDVGPTREAPKKKKRKRGKADLPNPEEDESLSGQARKALHYAFNQFDSPTSWKFNKARQNWLVRNLWSQHTIPDIYMPLLTKYLQGVQGGAREAIIKTCREILTTDASEPVEKVPTEGGDADGTTVPQQPPGTVNETKRSRATAVLAVLTENGIS